MDEREEFPVGISFFFLFFFFYFWDGNKLTQYAVWEEDFINTMVCEYNLHKILEVESDFIDSKTVKKNYATEEHLNSFSKGNVDVHKYNWDRFIDK